ncbi:thiol-disulfide isomerase/thioredoxin [Rahnella sp. BIGb0603]|jgi:thiol-disulfide isomerase/thioredoxin|uniref:protein disulfide oxidoreductase n=1 Tax=Rahnella TaxID=34037 RepID=UPI001265EC74|nr:MULTISPECIES: protein disulfide oxidoreductase [Rahnella]KAB8311687.1 protein disulfide oxidoreductase [Rouxiella chamberiensis]MCS3424352.1 thiol-disulfide isomerase/thioredoxin [Rahnella sp. BIGb0603]MDF1895027.1 protein disulfide oxidoreductase [Rahnella contaminans]
MIRLKRWVREGAIFVVLILVVMLGMDFLRAPQAPASFGSQPLQTLSNQSVTLSQQSQKRPLLVYFWATWCGVCKMTTPSVSRLAEEGENVLTVALRSGDNATLERYLHGKGIHMPVINDARGDLSAQWDIGVTPTFVVIDKGQVIATTTGWTSYWGMKARLWWAQIRT